MSITTHTHVFVAVQTSGPHESTDEILDLAIVAPDGSLLLHTAIAPEHLNDLPEDAPYTKGDLGPSPFFGAVAYQILDHLADPSIAGHNTQFAMRFINRWLRKALEEDELAQGRLAKMDTLFFDTVTLAWEQLPALEDRSLEGICHYLRIPYQPNHSALEDARAARTVYETLLRASAWKRWWWKMRAPKND
jgi:DNA polymerase III epsilon subunit-like protein